MMKKNRMFPALLLILLVALTAAASAYEASAGEIATEVSAAEEAVTEAASESTQVWEEHIPELDGLTFEKQMDFKYVECVDIYYYGGGYKFFDVYDSGQYLLIPEGGEIPDNLDPGVTIIQAPLSNVYMAATAVMALVNAVDGLDRIRFSSLEADGWYVEDAAAAMQSGEIVFAGKYSKPDYELLLSEGCDLAVESTMILHSPKVQEMLEDLGIPVFIDCSSYETHPLGRSEWAKVYGAMFGLEEQAEAFFEEQNAIMDELENFENTGKTVAFFYINTSNAVVVRRSGDSVPLMIELAGGKYALDGMEDVSESKRSSVNMTMEAFYDAAVDADYLIYNSTIDAPITSIDDLMAKSSLFANFKAVQEGNVWCADKYLYQATDIIGELIRDFHHMLTDGDESQMTFLRKID